MKNETNTNILIELFPILLLILWDNLEKYSKMKELLSICEFFLNIFNIINFFTFNNIFVILSLQLLTFILIYNKMNG